MVEVEEEKAEEEVEQDVEEEDEVEEKEEDDCFTAAVLHPLGFLQQIKD